MSRMKVLCILSLVAEIVHSAEIERVQLTHIDVETGRVRRSLTRNGDRCPQILKLNFTVNGDVVELNLNKSAMNQADPKLFILENGDINEAPRAIKQAFCVYQDLESRGSILVKCTNGVCRVEGSFLAKDEMYRLTSNEDASEAELEQVPVTETHFADDYVIIQDRENENIHPRRKREIPEGSIVELLACPDDSVYEYFKEVTGNETAASQAVIQYYAMITNEIDLHYQSIVKYGWPFAIRIYFAGVVLAKTSSDVPWSRQYTRTANGENYLDLDAALPAFMDWRLANLHTLPPHDFAFGYSRKELTLYDADGYVLNTFISGRSFASSVCKSSAVGIIEDNGRRVSYVSARELGNALGALPDSKGGCSDSDMNIMTEYHQSTVDNARLAANQWTFSSCSIKQVEDYISNLSSNCLQEHSFNATRYDHLRNLPLAGQFYSLDQQCKHALGPSALSCISRLAESDCHKGIYCRFNENIKCQYRLRYYVYAGTPCGHPAANKWCMGGICKPKSNATPNSTPGPPTTTTQPVPVCLYSQCCRLYRPRNQKSYGDWMCCVTYKCCSVWWGKNTMCCKSCSTL